jgi:hypothetical protein
MIDNEYEFRRGYNYGFSDGNADGKAWEQRRIIKLLDDWRCGHPDCDGDKTEVCYPKHRIIALIKGEK